MARAKKDNTVTAEVSSRFAKEYMAEEETVFWSNIEVHVKKLIPFASVRGIVDAAVNACFDSDGEYVPEMRSISLDVAVLSCYTDIALPDDPENVYAFVMGSGIMNDVLSVMNATQYAYIAEAVDDKIRYLINTNINAVKKGIEGVSAGIDEFTKSLGDVFAGVSADDITNVMSAIGNGGVDEEKLMRAYMKIKQPEEKLQAE